MPHGLLNLNKTAGMTSRQVVDIVQRLARPLKVGHAGTLDPLATGVLVVCVGTATRLIEYVQRMSKDYLGTFLLGRNSPTEDIEGEVAPLTNPPIPSLGEVLMAAKRFVGEIRQRPPAYSALKVAGQRAYALARRGESVELQPRLVRIHALDVVRYEYPELALRIACGGGTYVRSLGRDLAESLGTAAVMSALVRMAIGSFKLEDSLDPCTLTAENWSEHLLPMSRAVEALPKIVLSVDEIARVRNGLMIRRENPANGMEEIAALDSMGDLLAILCSRPGGHLGPLRNLGS